MRYPSSDNARVDATVEAFFDAVNSAPVKDMAALSGSSEATVLKWRRRTVQDPGVRPFLMMLCRAPMEAKLRILKPVLGALTSDYVISSVLGALQANFGVLRDAINARPPVADMAAHLGLDPRERGDARPGLAGVVDLVAAGPDGASGQAGDRCDGRPGQVARVSGGAASLALVETARDGIPGAEGEALRRHLGALSNVVSLDAARALVKGDNLGRTGLAYKRPGEDWKALVAPENRLWTPSADPRPITEYTGNVVELRRTLDEAARSPAPLYVSHAGALLRDGKLIPFHSNVVRIPGQATCGAEMVLTDFVRVTA